MSNKVGDVKYLEVSQDVREYKEGENLQLGVCPKEQEMSNGYFAMLIIYDLIVYALLSTRLMDRDGDKKYNNTLFHYEVVWLLFTDLYILGLPKNKRYFWNLFRCVQGIQIAWLTGHLWCRDLDDDEVGMTIARIATNMIRFVWGLIDTYRMGPHLQHWLLFLKERRDAHARWNLRQKFVYIYILLFLVVFILPDAFHNLHWAYDEEELNAPLTGCIATHSFCVFFKIFALEVMIRNKGEKACIALFMTFLFLSQWVIMTDMYIESALPYIHISGESVFVINSLFYLYEYCSSK